MQTPEHLKTETGEESFNPDGLAQRSIKLLKDTFPDIEVSARLYVVSEVESAEGFLSLCCTIDMNVMQSVPQLVMQLYKVRLD